MYRISLLLCFFGSIPFAAAQPNIDSTAAALFADGNYWKLIEDSKRFAPDTLSARFQFYLAMSYAALSEPQRAQELFRRAILLDSSRIQYRYHYARSLSQSGHYRDAIDQLTASIALDSSYIPAQFQLGLTYAAIKSEPEKELAVFSALAAKNPNDFLSLYYLSEAMKRSGYADSAAIYLQLSLKANGRYLPALIGIANYLIGQKRHRDALRYYLRADSVRGGNKDVLFQIGECHRKLNDLPAAIEYFKKAIALDTANGLYHAQLAYAYYSHYEYDSSVASYRRAILNDEENAQYHLNLALVYKRLDDTEMVVRSYHNAIAVMKGENISAVYNDLAAFHYIRKEWREAAAAYQRSVQITPTLDDPYFFIGSCHMQLKEYSRAYAAYREYLEQTKNDPGAAPMRASVQQNIEFMKTHKFIK